MTQASKPTKTKRKRKLPKVRPVWKTPNTPIFVGLMLALEVIGWFGVMHGWRANSLRWLITGGFVMTWGNMLVLYFHVINRVDGNARGLLTLVEQGDDILSRLPEKSNGML